MMNLEKNGKRKEFQNDCWIYGLMNQKDREFDSEIRDFLLETKVLDRSQEAKSVAEKMEKILRYYEFCGGDRRVATMQKMKERFWGIDKNKRLNPPSKWDKYFRRLQRDFRISLEKLERKIANS